MISAHSSPIALPAPPARPASVRIAAACLTVLYKILPRSLYDRMYFSLFPRYKAWQRRRYRSQALAKPNADTQKTETVFKCLEYSLVGWQGMEATYDCTKKVLENNILGDLVECGVAQGGSALLIGLVQRNFDRESRRLWLFDSYEGLPDATAEDYEKGKTGTHIRPLPKGSCLGTIEDVSDLLFEQNKLSRTSIKLVKGWFQDTLPVTRTQIGPIALLRLDGDWYESTKVCFENLFDAVSEGGYVILDDYFSCYGCKKASEEFLASRGKSYPIIPDGRGGSFFQKIG